MITTTKARKVETGGVTIDAEAYHIDTENIVHLTQVLRDMYSKPYEAIAREYVANAVDAHIEAGCADKAIDVTLPHASDRYFDHAVSYNFVVRDYGNGLDLADTKRLLFGYGASGEHKRMSNDQIGGFGVGCKCGFAVSDQFTYRVFYNGTVRVWRCYLDDNDMGQADLISETPSTEPSGIEITIPIKGNDSSRLVSSAEHLFDYLPVPVNLIQGTESRIVNNDRPETQYSGSLKCTIGGQPFKLNWRVLRNSAGGGSDYAPKCILGGYAYDLDIKQLTKLPGRSKLYRTLELELPIGYVPLAPNRESIKYTRAAIRVLEQTVSAVIEDLVKQQHGSTAATAIDQYRLLRQLDGFQTSAKYPKDTDEHGFDLSDIATKAEAAILTKANILIASTGYPETNWVATPEIEEAHNAQVQYYHAPDLWLCHGCRQTQEFVVLVPKIEQRGKARALDIATRAWAKYLFENWDNFYARYTKRAGTLLHPGRVTVLLAAPDNMSDLSKLLKAKAFVKDGSLKLLVAGPDFDDAIPELKFNPVCPCPPEGHVALTALRIDDGKHAEQATRRVYGYSHRPQKPPPPKIKAHSRKLVTLKPLTSGDSTYVEKASDAWEPVKAKDTQSGVYVSVDRFLISSEPVLSNCVAQSDGRHAVDWCRKWLGRTDATLAPARILGVRLKDVKDLEADPAFVSLYQYLRNRVESLHKAGTISEARMAQWFLAKKKCRVFANSIPAARTYEAIKDTLEAISKISRRIPGTDLAARSKALHNFLTGPLPEGTEQEAYELLWAIARKQSILHALGNKNPADGILTPKGDTPESNMLKCLLTNTNMEMVSTGIKVYGNNPIQDWYNFVHDKYPALIPLLRTYITGPGCLAPYTVDIEDYIPYIKAIG